FMIIAPNRLFLDYISEVLPELGVENVKQTTFEDLAQEWIGTELKFPDTFEKLRLIIGDGETPPPPEQKERIEAIARFKSSLRFKESLDAYIDYVEHHLLPAEDFAQGRWVVYNQAEIADLFFREYQHWPILKRLDQLKKHFNKRLKEQKDAITERMQRECNQRTAIMRQNMPETEERRRRILSLIDRKDETIRAAVEFAKSGAKEYIAKIPIKKPLEYYREFFTDPRFFLTFASDLEPDFCEAVRESTLALMDRKLVDHEDLAPLIYLKSRLHGLGEKVRIKHAVIDEAQDFSLFQFLMLKSVMKEGSFTILGDLNQGIHAYRAIERWEDVQEKVFGVDHCHLLTLEQCYRTTVEVMEAANKVIQKHPEAALARPVIRHGEPVRIIHKESPKAIAADIAEKIKELRGEDLRSFAIICKTLRGARSFLKSYPKGEEAPTLISGKEKAYYGGIVAVSSYLAKGLEFDAVFIPDADEETYGEESLDIKLFYVAMTRPLHKLYIYHAGELTGLLKE
ncbi:MAG TPA: 3'-5' exonuclease, partial [Bacillota bacterium]|nr:3'-5' exonuclease [Bacillota bacterium]